MALDGGANGGPAVEAAMVLQCREGERCILVHITHGYIWK